MVCKNCGTENEDGIKFCKSCGKELGEAEGNSGVNNAAPLQAAVNSESAGAAAAEDSKSAAGQQPKKKKSVLPIALIGGFAAIAAVIAIVVVIVLNSKPTIDLDDYLTIEFSGYDGFGTATVVIDWDDLEYDYEDKLSLTSQAKKEDDDRDPIDILRESISVSLNKETGLSNGDTVKYTWNVDEDLTTYVKCKVKYEDDSYSVKKLTEIDTFDAFADLDVSFSGVSTYGTVNYYYSGYPLSRYDFSCDKTTELSNGDTVTISLVNTDIEYYADYYGMIPVSLEKEYVVSDLREVESFDAFADLEVTFSGISPNGNVQYNYNGSNISRAYFRCDKTSGLRNGDTVIIYIQYDMETIANSIGMVPTSLEKEYTVSGLDEYVESYGALSDDFVAGLREEAEDKIYSYTANYYNASLTGLTYAGYIFNSVKEGNNSSTYNELYIIYSGTVSSSNGNFTASTVYFPVKFINVLSNESGFSYNANVDIFGSSYVDGKFSTKGYINPLSCYMALVEAKRENYTSECGDGFETYAEYDLITKLDDISEEYKEILYADARDKVESYIASNYNGGSKASDLEVFGEYLLLAKTQGTDFANNNKYYIVLSATVSNSQKRFQTTTVYFPVEYDGIVKLPGEEYMVTNTKGLVSNSVYFPNSSYRTRGYIDGEEMYSKLVTINREYYTYEVSENLKQFGE